VELINPINWDENVVADYRERIIIDPDSPILAFKASRDRYTNLPRQEQYVGKSYLGSKQSEDALTWNVFRTLQEVERLDIVSNMLEIGQPRGLLLWTLAPTIDDINAELQYTTGALIRQFDGVFRGQMTEPDVVLLGTTGIAVIECKLSEPNKAPAHLWEGSSESVNKRLKIYKEALPNLVDERANNEDIAKVYQLLRMAFYATKLGAHFQIEPVIISLANEKNWTIEIRKIRKSPSQLWDIFHNQILGRECLRCDNLTWQTVLGSIRETSLQGLTKYLLTHPCL